MVTLPIIFIVLFPTMADTPFPLFPSSLMILRFLEYSDFLAMYMVISHRYSIFQTNMQSALSIWLISGQRNFMCNFQNMSLNRKCSPHLSLFLKFKYQFDGHSLNNHLDHVEDDWVMRTPGPCWSWSLNLASGLLSSRNLLSRRDRKNFCFFSS